ncbi:DUF4097 family beta strand repeat-containing protein [Amycolatopsis viridis]|uniref:DUF4097 domain-containing protein n=1 Tax=Amycolatopsis viridis TaxID=185678 RepID=A0ABX0SN22_9PSEU|nr:DUF4097 family beta strand repeat-containing protein [Amycolatopsis viridis]NIH77938.1 hypothetical protein [Amycolatopsis viridis]
MGKPALAIGGVALIVAGAGIALAWNGWHISDRAEVQQSVTQSISSVQVDNLSGDVRIRVEDTATTSVHQTFHYDGAQPDRAYRVNGTQLVLDGCGNDCTADYDVVVPRGTTVAGTVTSGNLQVYGVASADLGAVSGNIEVADVAGPVTVHTQSGNIEVRLSVPEDVRAEALSGNVRVLVPPDRYRVTGDTTSGARTVGVVQDPSAQHVLELNSTSGDVSVAPA